MKQEVPKIKLIIHLSLYGIRGRGPQVKKQLEYTLPITV